jgi:hypothetical protein
VFLRPQRRRPVVQRVPVLRRVRRVPREARAEHGAVLEKEVELCIYWGGWDGTSENDVPLLTMYLYLPRWFAGCWKTFPKKISISKRSLRRDERRRKVVGASREPGLTCLEYSVTTPRISSAASRRACSGGDNASAAVDTFGQRASSACVARRGTNEARGRELLRGFGCGRPRTSGEGGFMMMLHASDTDNEADLWRFRRDARFGWWARICARAG